MRADEATHPDAEALHAALDRAGLTLEQLAAEVQIDVNVRDHAHEYRAKPDERAALARRIESGDLTADEARAANRILEDAWRTANACADGACSFRLDEAGKMQTDIEPGWREPPLTFRFRARVPAEPDLGRPRSRAPRQRPRARASRPSASVAAGDSPEPPPALPSRPRPLGARERVVAPRHEDKRRTVARAATCVVKDRSSVTPRRSDLLAALRAHEGRAGL
jgi:hypothetical protein